MTSKAYRFLLLAGVLQVFGVGLALHLMHRGAHEAVPIDPTLHWLRDSALAAPLAVAVLVAATLLARRVLERPGRRSRTAFQAGARWALAGSTAYALAIIPAGAVHARLFGAEHHAGAPVVHAVNEASAALAVSLVLLLALARLAGVPWMPAAAAAAAPRLPLATRVRAAAGLGAAASAFAVFALLAVPNLGGGHDPRALVSGRCPADARTVTYDVAAFEGVIPLNGWGDHMPRALMYALAGDDARVGKDDIVSNPNLTQPIVIRANVGDCIEVSLRNDIADRRVGMHSDALVEADPRHADGAHVGRNPDSTVGTGERITYRWYASTPRTSTRRRRSPRPSSAASTARS
jgi:hypothetical protein